jgi:flavin reductase (DIM6/NTAB) family NADH-FMN oxidoreductase RutF
MKIISQTRDFAVHTATIQSHVAAKHFNKVIKSCATHVLPASRKFGCAGLKLDSSTNVCISVFAVRVRTTKKW